MNITRQYNWTVFSRLRSINFLRFSSAISVFPNVFVFSPFKSLGRIRFGAISAKLTYTNNCPVRFLHSSSTNSAINMGVETIIQKIAAASQLHGKQTDKFIGYGTAGFRDKADVLDHIMFRVGILAALRSKVTQATTGVMITASHNPECDNGVKLVDPKGEMLVAEWEKHASDIANLSNEQLADGIKKLIEDLKISLNVSGNIYVGRDTRKSSKGLAKAVFDGIQCVEGTTWTDFGLCTTPLLHYLVVCKNTNGAYGDCCKEGYYNKLAQAFLTIVGEQSGDPLLVDCADGVGALAMNEILKLVEGKVPNWRVVNDNVETGSLNDKCGADFVKVKQTHPREVTPETGRRFASLDGDADRLIYYYFDKDMNFRMLDGDKIALLFTDYLGSLVNSLPVGLKMGIVQTAYANGRSTHYAQHVVGIPVKCVPTGVKYLHHAALEFDIGIYFEANGHGTVTFSDHAVKIVKELATKGDAAAKELDLFMNVINSCVGDAISDMLTVEAILIRKGWTAAQWDSMYDDLPNRQLKVSVPDRTLIKTLNAEGKIASPPELQIKIDELVSRYKNGRSFARPSGTEDIVRVYAEADSREDADKLAEEVAKAVEERLCKSKLPR